MKVKLNHLFRIESARYLPQLPPTHPCARMHGHSFKITLTIEGVIDPQLGWLMDYNDIKKTVAPILEQLDHKVLNQVPGLSNPTTESLCFWLFEQIKPHLTQLTKVTVSETEEASCEYEGALL